MCGVKMNISGHDQCIEMCPLAPITALFCCHLREEQIACIYETEVPSKSYKHTPYLCDVLKQSEMRSLGQHERLTGLPNIKLNLVRRS